MAQAQEAGKLLAQADKAYSSAGSGWNFFGSKTEKLENAAELYIKAAGAYRQNENKNLHRAGMAYEKVPLSFPIHSAFSPCSHTVLHSDDYTKAAAIQGTKLNEPDDMANTLQDAFKAYRKESPPDAARCLSQAIDHYLSKGNFRRAATQKQILAELYEEMRDQADKKKAYEDAAQHQANARSACEAAAQWYEDDNATALANKLSLKAADFAALDGDYLDAIKRYEHVAKQSVSNNLMRFSVRDYLLRAGLCHLALDIIGAKRALENYRALDPQFPSTNQGILLANLLEIVEQGDSEAFEQRLRKYEGDGVELNNWQIKILVRVKNQITEKEEDFS